MTERVTCVMCGRNFAGRVPEGGDGSVLFPRRHKKHYSARVPYALQEDCPGSYEPAREYQENTSWN